MMTKKGEGKRKLCHPRGRSRPKDLSRAIPANAKHTNHGLHVRSLRRALPSSMMAERGNVVLLMMTVGTGMRLQDNSYDDKKTEHPCTSPSVSLECTGVS
jgi:hypothetical protein